MKKLRSRVLPLFVLATALLQGCSTIYVDRGLEAAAAGKAYAEAMTKVNEAALSRSIAFTATTLAFGARTEPVLDDLTQKLKTRATLTADYQKFLNALAAYFKNLEALAKGDQSKETSDAVAALGEALKKDPISAKFSDQKAKAVSGLSGVIMKEVHSQAVQRALRRDAETVAGAIGVADATLEEQASWISTREEADRTRAWNVKVMAPYLKKEEILGDAWRTEWSAQVRPSAVLTALVEARVASKSMQEAWKDTLKGTHSLVEIAASLTRVQAALDSISAVKDEK